MKGKGAPAWLLLRLAQLGAQAGLVDRAIRTTEFITDPGLRGQAELAVLRARLTGNKDKADDGLTAAVTDKTAARALAWMAVARHNARQNGSVAKAVEGWEEPYKTMGLAGLALGLQDKR